MKPKHDIEVIVSLTVTATVKLPDVWDTKITDDEGSLLPLYKRKAVEAATNGIPESLSIYLDGRDNPATKVYYDGGSIEIEDVTEEEV